MPKTTRSTFAGDLVTEAAELTLEDVCSACSLPREKVVAYVEEGIIEPKGSDVVAWRFSRMTVIALHRAVRLERDLGLNAAGIALAFEHMSEIELLKRKLARFEKEGGNDDANE